MVNQTLKTIRYFPASKLANVSKSSEAAKVISSSSDSDNIAVLLSITNPVIVEKAVNITKEGFDKIRMLV